MTLNAIFALVVEVLFSVVFVGALVDVTRRRDPVSRDVALTFSPFPALLLIAVWRAAFGAAPVVLSLPAALLLFAQPIFALHLASLLRPVRRRVIVGSALLLIASLAPAFLMRSFGAVAALPLLIVFALVELLSAGYLALEARRRHGPGRVRLALAAGSTVAFASGLLTTGIGLIGPELGDVSNSVALAMIAVAGFGYLIAFVPPGHLRAIWLAEATVSYQRDLLDRSSGTVADIWLGFAELARDLTGSGVAVVDYPTEGAASVLAAVGLSNGTSAVSTPIDSRPIDAPLGDSFELPVARLPPDDPARRLAESAGAAFVSVVPIGADGWGHRSLVVASAHRSLFHTSDLDLLGTLGAQTGIVADRRATLADQEALAARLAETVEALRSASRAKSDFLASMSHELRTPLSAILGFSDLMRHEPAVGDAVSVPVEWVEHVHRGGEHLLALVNDVLDLSKVEAGRMELTFETIDLRSAVTELANGLRPLADRKALTLETDVAAIPLVADRARFRQIVYNLVSNAIKFTPKGGRVTIAATERDGTIRLTVQDTGVGISPDELPVIFDEFRQVGKAKDREGGTGLGLALAQRLIEAHGGTIEVDSMLGEGTTFTVTLPSRIAGPAGASLAATDGAAIDGLQDHAAAAVATDAGTDILVIEDDPSAVHLLREYLEPMGYALRAAADGRQGLAMAAERRPLAILLDVLVPLLDGWEVLRTLKDDPRLRDVPVVMVTIVDEREVGLALGAVDYLVKPVHREALLACLERIGLTGTPERPPTILAVDDEPAALQLVDRYLAGTGYDVLRASSGRQAIELARSRPVDLVICDLLMPDLDGFEVVAQLKADERTAPIPILICTAHDLTASEKARLHGRILGIVAKGPRAREGLRGWLAQLRTGSRTASAAPI